MGHDLLEKNSSRRLKRVTWVNNQNPLRGRSVGVFAKQEGEGGTAGGRKRWRRLTN